MKHRFDKTRVARSCACAAATAVLGEVSVFLNPFAAKIESIRYVQQLTYILTAIMLVVTLNSLRKLIPKSLRRAVLDKLLYALRKVASGIAKVSKRVLSFFGIRFDRYKKVKDERSFVFDPEEMGITRKRHSVKSNTRWRDLTENAEKVRFIYVKYVVKLIKSGYKFFPFFTPNEVKDDLKYEDGSSEAELFEMYNGARYSGGSVYISDEQVETALALVNGKKR